MHDPNDASDPKAPAAASTEPADPGPFDHGSRRGAAPPKVVIAEDPEPAPGDSEPARTSAASADKRVEPAGGARSAGTEPAPPRPSWARRLGLGLGLAFGTLFGVLPLAYLAWAESTAVATAATAELLDDTHGLDPGTFESAYWFGLVVNWLVLAWCLVRRLRGRPHPVRPLVVLIGVYAAGLALLVWPAVHGGSGIPSGLTTFVLLGTEWLWQWVAPLVVFYFIAWGVWRTSRAGWANVGTARMFTALGLVAGLAGLQLLASGTFLAASKLQITAAVTVFAAPGDVSGEYQGMVRIASIDGLEGAHGVPAQERFKACSTELATATEGGRRFLDAQIVRLASPPSALRVVDAEDLVMDTLLKVCRRHMKSALQEIKAYFVRSLQNARAKFCSRSRREVPSDAGQRETPCPAGFRSGPEGVALREAMRRLSDGEQRVLFDVVVEGKTSEELARELGTAAYTVRKRKERALRHLREVYEGEL